MCWRAARRRIRPDPRKGAQQAAVVRRSASRTISAVVASSVIQSGVATVTMPARVSGSSLIRASQNSVLPTML
jgi:hypothetical protein